MLAPCLEFVTTMVLTMFHGNVSNKSGGILSHVSQLINALHHCITRSPKRGLGSYRSRFAQGPWELCDEPFATQPKFQVGGRGFLRCSIKVPPQKKSCQVEFIKHEIKPWAPTIELKRFNFKNNPMMKHHGASVAGKEGNASPFWSKWPPPV